MCGHKVFNVPFLKTKNIKREKEKEKEKEKEIMMRREKVFDGRREEKYLNLNKIKKKEGGIFFF
jgi:hypothetical protein